MRTLITSVTVLLLLLLTPALECQINYGSNEQAGKYVDVNDVKVYCETYGTGEPLFLLHGNGGSIENFLYQIPELSKHFKVIAVFLPQLRGIALSLAGIVRTCKSL